MLDMPEVLSEKKYAGMWEWDGWKPKAKPSAPEALKRAIDSWVKAVEDAEDDGDGIVSL